MQARADAAEATGARVLDAAVELFTESPFDEVSLEQVANRSGVATRTVIRRFGSKEDLFGSAMRRAAEIMMAQRNEAPVGDIAGAVRNVIAHYEKWGENRLRLIAQEDRIDVVRENVRGGRAFHRDWVERTFAPLLVGFAGAARQRRVAALIALTDVFMWKLLRRDHGLSRAQTERTIVELITALQGENR